MLIYVEIFCLDDANSFFLFVFDLLTVEGDFIDMLRQFQAVVGYLGENVLSSPHFTKRSL